MSFSATTNKIAKPIINITYSTYESVGYHYLHTSCITITTVDGRVLTANKIRTLTKEETLAIYPAQDRELVAYQLADVAVASQKESIINKEFGIMVPEFIVSSELNVATVICMHMLNSNKQAYYSNNGNTIIASHNNKPVQNLNCIQRTLDKKLESKKMLSVELYDFTVEDFEEHFLSKKTPELDYRCTEIDQKKCLEQLKENFVLLQERFEIIINGTIVNIAQEENCAPEGQLLSCNNKLKRSDENAMDCF